MLLFFDNSFKFNKQIEKSKYEIIYFYIENTNTIISVDMVFSFQNYVDIGLFYYYL